MEEEPPHNNCSHTFSRERMIFGALFKSVVAMLTWCMWCCRSSLQSDWLKGWAVLARAGKTYPKSRYHKLYCHFWKRQEWVAARWVLSRTPATEKSFCQRCWRLRKTWERPAVLYWAVLHIQHPFVWQDRVQPPWPAIYYHVEVKLQRGQRLLLYVDTTSYAELSKAP